MPRALAKTIDAIARQKIGKDWNLYAALLDHWQEIVGQDYARVTTPIKVTFPHQPNEPKRCNGTLYIRLPKGLTMEFTFKTEQIRQRINGYFGYNAISKIAFEAAHTLPEAPSIPQPVSPETLAAIAETAKAVDNDELRAALESFGTAVAKSSNGGAQRLFAKHTTKTE